MNYKTIADWLNEFGYELNEGYNYESVYPFRSMLDNKVAKEIIIDAVQSKIIKKI